MINHKGIWLTYSCEMQSNLSKDEILKRISTDLCEKRSLFEKVMYYNPFDFDIEFFGTVFSDGFKIRRMLPGKNLFIPQVSGSIIQENNTTIIKIKVEPRIFPLSFFYFWSALWLGMSFIMFIGVLKGSQNLSIGHILISLFPYVFLCLIYGFVLHRFRNECKYSLDFIKQTLKE